MVRFPAVKATQLRVKINECRLTAHISQVAAYYADPLEEENRTENWNNLPRASWKQVAASPLTIDLGKEVETLRIYLCTSEKRKRNRRWLSVTNST